MDKKSCTEIKKCLKIDDCRLDRMCGIYIGEEENGDKAEIFRFSEPFLSLEDEDLNKYCDIFKKILTGKFGRNLYNVNFSNEDELEGGTQEFLCRLLASGLKEEQSEMSEILNDYFQKLVEACHISGRYLIVVAHGVYDIPGKTTDGLTLDDASEEVYDFLLTACCPVTLVRDGLCCDMNKETFHAKYDDWAVQKPEWGMLFPAFNDRSKDIHSALYYTKSLKDRYEEVAEAIFGHVLSETEDEQKDMFRTIIEKTLGNDCSFDKVKSITDSVDEKLKDAESEESEEPVTITKSVMEDILREAGADAENLDRLSAVFDETMGDSKASITADMLRDSKDTVIQSDIVNMKIKSEMSDVIESRVIDGREYLLVPISDDITVNGIHIRQNLKKAGQDDANLPSKE